MKFCGGTPEELNFSPLISDVYNSPEYYALSYLLEALEQAAIHHLQRIRAVNFSRATGRSYSLEIIQGARGGY
jgi:hypothetical protein